MRVWKGFGESVVLPDQWLSVGKYLVYRGDLVLTDPHLWQYPEAFSPDSGNGFWQSTIVPEL